jgi:hypothetical protein
MKKLVVSLVMFVSVFGATLASDGSTKTTKVTYRVESAFKKEFEGATSVKWELMKGKDVYQAQFIYNNERLNAYFDFDGNLIATGRFVAVANLPILVRKNIYQKYGEYTIKEVAEFATDSETSYLIALENEKAKLLVRAYNNGSSFVFKKEKKNSLSKL